METCNDTLPLPAEVEREFVEHGGDRLNAATWPLDREIDPAPILNRVGKIALVQYWNVWNPETGRYRFLIYTPDHVGPKRQPVLAIPIIENGEFVDLLLIGDDMSFETASCCAPWLGRENITATVRLHVHALDWLEAGCTGACHIALISRKALKALRSADCVECDDIGTALDARSWAFDADENELSRFVIDDTASIRQYIENEIRWRTAFVAVELEGAREF